MGHARLSPSAAERWFVCPGSVELTKDLPDETSPYAQEGINAHFLLEHCLRTGETPLSNIGRQYIEPGSGEMFQVTQEMADAVAVAYNLVAHRFEGNKQSGGNHWKLHVETKLYPTSLGRFDIDGTGDIVIETDTYNEIVDYKHGAGIAVEIVGNRQLQIYGRGAIDTLGLDPSKPLVTTIVQPRAEHPDGKIRSVMYQPHEVEQFSAEILEAANRTDDPNAPFNPVDKKEVCGWCKARATCAALAEHNMQAAQAVFNDISDTNTSEIQANLLRQPKELSLEQVAMILSNADLITSWVGAVKDFARKQMQSGVDIPGFKLVTGRKSKKWDCSDEELEALMRSMKRTDRKKVSLDDIYDRKMRSPAGMEKAMKSLLTDANWNKVKEHIKVVPGAPQIASASSSKPAVTIKAEDVFENIEPAEHPLSQFF